MDAIVNCTGMGAAELAGASMVPLRGALVRVPVARFPSRPKTAYAIAIRRLPSGSHDQVDRMCSA
ncbi:hypothetical protein [Streptomyces anulatus]|uniref:hypothetical protein n=1 Tax=Streptomyces anulatus TaxID=1892 RepID=UPI0034311B3B